MAVLAPSILSADFSELARQVELTEAGGAGILHIDVMDGHFVPNISFGAVVMKSLVGKTDLPFDVHLMIENADKYVADFVTDQTEYITIHAEANADPAAVLTQIKDLGVKAGISINPETPVASIDHLLGLADLVLIMSVHPGFGGQSFIEASYGKLEELAAKKREKDLAFVTEIDGGINLENAPKVVEAGVDLLVAGSAVFGAEDITGRTREFVTAIG